MRKSFGFFGKYSPLSVVKDVRNEKVCTVCTDPVHEGDFCVLPTPNNRCGRQDTPKCKENPNNETEYDGKCFDFPNYWNTTETCISTGYDEDMKI